MKITYKMTIFQLPEISSDGLNKEAILAKAKDFSRLGYDVKVIQIESDGMAITRSMVIYESGE